MGISWEKVVVAKKYMYCHENVVKWNDSAGEEAFNNAKNRFWAKINGFPCEYPLPDPNMYIDEIDWYPDIDPELMLELDREYFNPDEAEKHKKVGKINQKAHNSVPGCTIIWNDVNPSNGDNPWECRLVQGTGTAKNKTEGWDKWDKEMNLQTFQNPWEKKCTQGDEASKDNAWRACGNELRGWNEGLNSARQSVGSLKEKGWGGVGNNSRASNQWETSVRESKKLDNGGTHLENKFTQARGAPNNRGWRDCRNDSWGWKHWENLNEPKHLDSRRLNADGGYLDRGCRKRAGPQQHALSHKTSRFRGDDYGIGDHWREGRTQKGVNFVFQ
ncbi:unnamed protein product [Ilex paraguariensis]|uniref:Uncharacterized protein n=1 Tax=Ilex paraguariensis TaxID=185542 RepID=A0ABC8SXU2_9AQUA